MGNRAIQGKRNNTRVIWTRSDREIPRKLRMTSSREYYLSSPLFTTSKHDDTMTISAPPCPSSPQVSRLPKGLLTHDLRGDVTAGAE